MKQVTHYEKVMWGLYCDYSYIPSDVWYTERNKYEWYTDEDGECRSKIIDSYPVQRNRRSAAEWSFIHSKYHYITKVDPIYTGSLEDFISYLGKDKTRYGNPYKYKYNNWNFRFSHQCGKHTYRWRCTSGRPSGYQKKPHHKKKELSDHAIAKKDWREKKNLKKDKAKAYWKRGAGKYYKKFSNKLHRQWERRMINNGKTEEMSQIDYKYFLDPWLWD